MTSGKRKRVLKIMFVVWVSIPKDPCVQDLVASLGCYWGLAEPIRRGA